MQLLSTSRSVSSSVQRSPAACTIIARNYLSHARILAKSYLQHEPGGRFYLLVVDKLPEEVCFGADVHVIEPEELDFSNYQEMCLKYDVTELSTAVKARLLSVIFNHYREDQVIYFDPDIFITRPLDELKEALASTSIVLIPHLLKPIPMDGYKPSEQDILIAGAYNLGFIALKQSYQVHAFLKWWEERLLDKCRVAPSQGLFVDQKWIDLVPSLFSSTIILRDDTYNVAYWNIHSRVIERCGEQFFVNGRPLAFFHFSNFDPAKCQVLSKHQNRTEVVKGTALADLLELYADLHIRSGYLTTSKWSYGYSKFNNDIGIHPLLRQLYLELDRETRLEFGNPFRVNGINTFFDWATRPQPDEANLSLFLLSIYRSRPDLADVFPDVRGRHREGFIDWAITVGSHEIGYDPQLIRVDGAMPNAINGSAQKEDTTWIDQNTNVIVTTAPEPDISASTGIVINTLLRQLYMDLDEEPRMHFSDPFHSDEPNSFLDWATKPRPEAANFSLFLIGIYRSRPDVAAAFPDIWGKDREGFVNWAKTEGAYEIGYDPQLIRVDAVMPAAINGNDGTVADSALAASYSISPPISWAANETQMYTVTITNTGSQTWNGSGANPVRLGVHFCSESDTSLAGWVTDQHFTLSYDLTPGNSQTMSIRVAAPSTAGNYILCHCMVKEDVAWFDQVQKTNTCVKEPIPATGTDRDNGRTGDNHGVQYNGREDTPAVWDASYHSSPPTSWSANETRIYTVTLTNNGTEIWNINGANPVALGVHFGAESDGLHEGWVTDQRFDLHSDLDPGCSQTLTICATAPSIAGNYVLRHRVLKEGIVWFDQIQTTNITVTEDVQLNVDIPNSMLSGVNVCGYLQDESGIGSATRGYIRALHSLGVPLAFKDLSELSRNRSEDRSITTFDDDHPYNVNLMCFNADEHFAIIPRIGLEFFQGSYNIGVWWWELPHFPEKWYDRFPYYDEIWVGTSFIANTLAPVSPVPVVRIPPVLATGTYGSRDDGRRRLGVFSDEFIYLFVFDFHSYFERKNPLALIDAFKMAFRPSDPARLIIKCVNSDFSPHNFAAMKAGALGYPVSIYDGYWTLEEMRDLMAACDVYVSLHRSEGLGLTIADAMAHGKPVIATGWSGNVDFMNVSNSFPVRCELVENEENVGPYRVGEVWANPSIEHAAGLMRLAFEDRETARVRGQAAKRAIEIGFSAEAVASLIQHRIAVIGRRQRFAAFKQELENDRVVPKHIIYQQLIHQLRNVVNTTLPPDATVIVVSKGDNELLKLEGRHAWHFPQTEDGQYAGSHPANSALAIAHLEALRAKGGEFLIFPSIAFWWLDHYAEFKQHLEIHYQVVECQEDTCLIFALRTPKDQVHGNPVSSIYTEETLHQLSNNGNMAHSHGSSGAELALAANYSSDPPISWEAGDIRMYTITITNIGTQTWNASGSNPVNLGIHFGSDNDLPHEDWVTDQRFSLLSDLAPNCSQILTIVITAPPTTGSYILRHRLVKEDVAWFDQIQKTKVIVREAVEDEIEDSAHRSFGLNLAGYIASEKGVGEATRSVIRSVRATNIPYVLNNFADPGSANLDTTFVHFSADNPYGINLIQVNPGEMPRFASEKRRTYFHNHYNIGYWWWELSSFPEEWQMCFQYFNEIWVGSTFALDAISRVTPIPVVRIPLSLPERKTAKKRGRSHFGLAQDKFIFLFVFDFHSLIERKNPQGLIRAFKKAFSKKDDALLVLKCSHSTSAPAKLQAIRANSKGANIQIIDSILSREDLNTLLSLSDCYVSLHRAEGFGLPLAEAMSLKKPVIATSYSGNMDFMTSANSFLVNHNLIEIEQDHGPYKKGYVWADPDLDHAAELMRFVYENRGLAKEVGRKAQQDIRRALHPQVVGGLIKERLLRVAEFGQMKVQPNVPDARAAMGMVDPTFISSKYIQYQQLIRRVREVVSAVAPPATTVVVVSKGDDELLNLDGRQAWHFPQNEDGTYAGFYPANSAMAIAHLEALRAKRADFLLFPHTALWWLDHYAEFKQHLERHYRVVLHQEETGVIFALHNEEATPPDTASTPAVPMPSSVPEQQQRRARCSIIIPVHNKASLTQQCLDTLLACSPQSVDFEIIVVDDGSTDMTLQLLAGYGDQVHAVTHSTNTGFATACNDGAAVASGEYVVFLNNDTIPQTGWLDALVSYADSHTSAAAVGSKLLFPNDTIQHAGMVVCQDLYPRHIYTGFPADHPAVNRSRRFKAVTGACILIRRILFEQVGGFDTTFVNSFEDVDLCLRLGELGYEIHYCHESVLYHLEAVSREGRTKEEQHNAQLYHSRWARRVQSDDLKYYVEDGLLVVDYQALYPVNFRMAPLLAVTDGDKDEGHVDRLYEARTRQVLELLKENIRLSVRIREAEFQAVASSSNGATALAVIRQQNKTETAQDEVVERNQTADQQTRPSDTGAEEAELISSREDYLQGVLLDAQDQPVRSDNGIEVALHEFQASLTPGPQQHALNARVIGAGNMQSEHIIQICARLDEVERTLEELRESAVVAEARMLRAK
jgi:GT2 family glycosyltransferase/glycosyltransferase involved in cell wall biosynthesis